jgi:hypothetical protein
VDCSLAVVSESHATPHTDATAAAVMDADAGADTHHHHCHHNHQQRLLLSRGHGDIVLMQRRGDRVSYSNAVYPLRPQSPYTGVRPLILEAAFAHENGAECGMVRVWTAGRCAPVCFKIETFKTHTAVPACAVRGDDSVGWMWLTGQDMPRKIPFWLVP